MRVSFRVNGDPVAVDVEPRLHLADCLRDVLSLTGTHMWTAPVSQGLGSANGLVDCGHMSGLCARQWPLAQMGYADRVPNMKVMSEHRWVPRGVPILGPTDRHLAAVLASARAVVR